MKQIFILFLSGMGLSVSLCAQLNLQPGATWLFNGTIWPSLPNGEKWEYVGDSVSSEGDIKRIRVTRHEVSSPGLPFVQAEETVFMKYFTVKGDSIWLDGRLFADFSLAQGDTVDSPLLTSEYRQMYACDSLFLYYPAIVSGTGTETVNGNTYRNYRLRYLSGIHPDSMFVEITYSEYSWLTNGYWWQESYGDAVSCSHGFDPAYSFRLACYSDDQHANPAVCNRDWFDKMGLEETDLSAGFSLYPNPAADVLNIHLPETGENWQYKIVSVDGKQLINGLLSMGRLEVAALGSGLYFLLLENGSRTERLPFVKQ